MVKTFKLPNGQEVTLRMPEDMTPEEREQWEALRHAPRPMCRCVMDPVLEEVDVVKDKDQDVPAELLVCRKCGRDAELSRKGHRGATGPTVFHDCPAEPGSPVVMWGLNGWLEHNRVSEPEEVARIRTSIRHKTPMVDVDVERCRRYAPAVDFGCGDDCPEAYMEEDADGEYVALEDAENRDDINDAVILVDDVRDRPEYEDDKRARLRSVREFLFVLDPGFFVDFPLGYETDDEAAVRALGVKVW